MTDFREVLKPHLGHRVTIRGELDEIRVDHNGSRACVQKPEMEGEVFSSYVWVMEISDDWLDSEGCLVEFSATVNDYNDGGGTRYGLKKPGNFKRLTPPPIRATKTGREVANRMFNGAAHTAPPPPPAPPRLDHVDTLRQVKAFIRAAGSAEVASRIVKVLESTNIPVSELAALIAVLSEE